MSTNLILALEITAIGMGLVFAAILLLWAVMAALVRLVNDPPEAPEEAEAEGEAPALVEASPAVDHKRIAAAIAVAYALAEQADGNQPHEFPLPPTSIVSAWQAIMRTRIINKRGSTR